jgi:hypothetical protein
MGKYTKLRGKLPAFPVDKTWQEKINAFKQKFLGTRSAENANARMLSLQFATREKKKDDLEAAIKKLNVEIEALSQMIVESLEGEQFQQIDLSSGESISIKDTPYSSVIDRKKLFAWIKETHSADLLSVNTQTLNGLNNDRLLAGQPAVPGTKVFMKTRAKVSSSKTREKENKR